MLIKLGRCLLRQRLNEIRKDQKWLSETTGIPKGRISEYVNNNRVMGLETAKTIAVAVGCAIEDLYTWE